MAASPDDHILVLHKDDGRDWAKFLSSRLANPPYDITCVLKDLAQPAEDEKPPTPPRKSGGSVRSQSQQPKEEAVEEEIYMNQNPCDSNNNRNSGNPAGAGGTANATNTVQNQALENCIRQSKATVFFLSPDIVQGDSPFPVNTSFFSPKTTVFLLLGVEVEEARSFFGSASDHVFKCRISVVDGTEVTIRDALTQIIEAYECNASDDGADDLGGEDIYQHPPSPVQANRIDRVFPQHLAPGEREVFVLLARQAEDCALVVLEDNMSMEIPLNQVCDRLYSFTLPKSVQGEISFHVECSGHPVGQASVKALTPLDQIRETLTREVTPMAVLATALGLSPDDVGGVDTALAFKLQEMASAVTFSRLFPCEDVLGQNSDDEKSNLLWPSLLHFAADLNLRTLCSELLRYPGMLGAALTENREGLYPCQMAAKKGFTQIERDLLKFVELHKTECYDSDNSDYVQPSAALVGKRPSRAAPTGQGAHGKEEDGQVYVEMGAGVSSRPPIFGLHQQNSVHSNDSVFASSSSREDEEGEELYSNLEDVKSSTLPKSRDSTLTRHNSDISGTSSVQSDCSNSPTARKALKILGVQEQAIQMSRSSTINPCVSPSDVDPSAMLPYLAASPPGVYIPKLSDSSLNAGSRESVSSNCDDPAFYSKSLGRDNVHKPNVMRDKLKSFFFKIRGNSSKRNNSEGDISNTLKKSPGSRQSVGSNKSDNSNKLGAPKKTKSFSCDEEVQERDSGSYSDEEKDKGPPSPLKRNKQRVFKESDRPMNRRISRRAQQAKKEKIDNAPSLPSQEKRRGAFRSFIETDDQKGL